MDGEFSFGIDLDNFVLAGLKIGQELDERRVGELKDTADFQKVFEKVLRFAMIRQRSKKEFLDYFRRKKVNMDFHQKLFEKLDRLGFLNDVEFARLWVDGRKFKKSKKVLKLELLKKGIDRNTIEDILADTDTDEISVARKLAEKRITRWKGLDEKTRKLKISQYLAGKGFDWDIINKVGNEEI